MHIIVFYIQFFFLLPNIGWKKIPGNKIKIKKNLDTMWEKCIFQMDGFWFLATKPLVCCYVCYIMYDNWTRHRIAFILKPIFSSKNTVKFNSKRIKKCALIYSIHYSTVQHLMSFNSFHTSPHHFILFRKRSD